MSWYETLLVRGDEALVVSPTGKGGVTTVDMKYQPKQDNVNFDAFYDRDAPRVFCGCSSM